MRATLAVFSLLLGGVQAGAADAPARKIVLISIDTLRADHLGCYAPSESRLTPELDAFAKESVVFDNAFTQATWTLPSHASLLTSLYPSEHGAGSTDPTLEPRYWRGLRPGLLTLAQVLRQGGYKTLGLFSTPVLEARWGFSKGFDQYGWGRYADTDEELTLPTAADRLRAAGGGRIFAFIHSNIVHDHVRLKSAPRDDDFQCPITKADFLPAEDDIRPMPGNSASPLCSVERHAYDRAVFCMDRKLGALLDSIGDDALIVLTADHGEALCDHHVGTPPRGHGYRGYDDQLHVPLLIRLPGRRYAGRHVREPVREIDIAATVVAAAGLPVPAAFSGKSLLPLLDGPQPESPTPILSEGEGWRSLRTRRYKLIVHADGPQELYDLREDPLEQNDLASRRPATVRRLLRQLDAFALKASSAAGTAPALDERIKAALRAEGYLR